ncbi:MAG: methyltransferase domain-containing protein [Mesorhizobium sp.]|nr:MAG: methyltransferase domain-containing protein [Mesorhizobium sp.]
MFWRNPCRELPALGAPVADDLIGIARLQPGQRVLDVACGTGVVTRLAADCVGASDTGAGLDVNAGMLAVARSHTPPDISIEWYEASSSRQRMLCAGRLPLVLSVGRARADRRSCRR